jgi:predicted nucleic acid-binding protein
MAYLEKEPGYEKIKDLFVKAAESGRNLLMITVNWGEVFYVLIRHYGIKEADKVQRLIETFPIDFIPADLPLTRQAALYKTTKKLPYMDCFVAALAKLNKGEVITSDKDFKALENEVRISWIN